jgi:hypothetical protein
MTESSNTNSPRVTVEGTNELVAKQVPIGSSKPQVIAFLDAHKIQHSDYSEHPERESDFRDPRLDKKRKLIKGYISAIIRDVGNEKQSTLAKWDVQIFFYFDEQGSLVDYNVKGVGTSF